MADMYTPEEINAIFDAYNKAIQNNQAVSKELAQAYEDAKKGVKNYTRELNASMKALGHSAAQLTRNLYDSKQGADQFSGVIDGAADVTAKYASKMGVFGMVLGGAIKALSMYVGAVNRQSDALYKSFQELTRFGAIGAGGMTDVYDSLKRFGYGVAELDNMTQLLRENAQDLAMFNGSVFRGTDALADLASGLQSGQIQRRLMNMGLSVDEINRGSAGYYIQLGRLNRQTQATAAGAAQYLVEMEALSKITGMTRKEMEEQRERANQIDAFYANLEDMDPKAANTAYQIFNQLMAFDPSGKKATAFAQSMNGIIGQSEEQMQAFMATGGESVRLAQAVRQGTVSFDEYFRSYAEAQRQLAPIHKQLSLIEGAGKFMGDYYGQQKMNAKLLGTNNMLLADSIQEQERMGQGFDGATDAATGLRQSQMRSRDALENFVNAGVTPVTRAMEILAKAVEYLTLLIPFGSRAKAQYEKQKAAAAGAGGEDLTAIREMIAKGESGGNYNILQGGQTAPLTSMSIAEVLDLQEQRKSLGMNTAAGKYQIINQTLKGLISKGGIDMTAKFDEAMQDRLANMLIEQRGYQSYKSGMMSKEQFMSNLSKEWAALPGGPSGQSYYAGVGNNRSAYSWEQALGSFDAGGIATGPKSGYMSMLHGTEAVIPLPDGRSVPVTSTTSTEQVSVMTAQLDKLDEIVGVMKNQLAVSNKLLQYQS